jgi:hypothetical protein
MSRLDSFIRRLSAQRDILNQAAADLGDVPGLVLEFGLGGGRTYDHLRHLFPDRRVVVFESVPLDNPLVQVPRGDLILGDIRATAAGFPAGSAALIHADIETGVAETDAALANWLPELVSRLLTPGGFAASGAPLVASGLVAAEITPSVEAGRYHLVRRTEA